MTYSDPGQDIFQATYLIFLPIMDAMDLCGTITGFSRVLEALQATVARTQTIPASRLGTSEFEPALGGVAKRLMARIYEEHRTGKSGLFELKRFATAINQLVDGLFWASSRRVIRVEYGSKKEALAIFAGALSLWPDGASVNFPGGISALTTVLEQSAVLAQQAATVASEGEQVSYFRQAVAAGRPVTEWVEVSNIKAKLSQISVALPAPWGNAKDDAALFGIVTGIGYFLERMGNDLQDLEVARGLLFVATSLNEALKIWGQESEGHQPGQLEMLDRLYRVISCEIKFIEVDLSSASRLNEVNLKRKKVREVLERVAMIERVLQTSLLRDIHRERKGILPRTHTWTGLPVRPGHRPAAADQGTAAIDGGRRSEFSFD